MDITWDCIIIGGGAAGLSAALVLGRAQRRVLVLDAGRQSNLASHGVGGLLGQNAIASGSNAGAGVVQSLMSARAAAGSVA